MRYLSDASYWLYLTHLPLVIGAQMLLVTWPINIHLQAPSRAFGSKRGRPLSYW